MHASGQVLFASRIPTGLKERLSHFCEGHGMKINFFVSQAIKERLERLAEDESDVAFIQARQKDAEYVTQGDMDAYFKKRLAK